MIGRERFVTAGVVLGRIVVGTLATALLAGLAVGLVPATSTGASGPLLPTADPFYRWSGALAHDTPGTILRTRTIAVAYDGGPTTSEKSTQLLYVTTDELGRKTVSVATVLQPLDEAASAAHDWFPTRLPTTPSGRSAIPATPSSSALRANRH